MTESHQRSLGELFSKEGLILAQRVLDYYQRQFENNPNQQPIGLDASLLAYFQEDWEDLVIEGRIPPYLIGQRSRYHPHILDVEDKLEAILFTLEYNGYLIHAGNGRYFPRKEV